MAGDQSTDADDHSEMATVPDKTHTQKETSARSSGFWLRLPWSDVSVFRHHLQFGWCVYVNISTYYAIPVLSCFPAHTILATGLTSVPPYLGCWPRPCRTYRVDRFETVIKRNLLEAKPLSIAWRANPACNKCEH